MSKRWVLLKSDGSAAEPESVGKRDVIARRDVRRLDIDAARAERQQQIEKQLELSRDVAISSADGALVFARDDGKESGRAGVSATVEKRGGHFKDVVFADADEPYRPRKGFRSLDQ
jgi:hypothetical protein